MKINPHEPYEWFLVCGKYAIENKYCMDFGCLFLLQPYAPQEVIKAYRKYIDFCKKPFHSRGLSIVRNNCIVDFLPTDDPIEQEQIEIVKELIKTGYLDNDPFLKFM